MGGGGVWFVFLLFEFWEYCLTRKDGGERAGRRKEERGDID